VQSPSSDSSRSKPENGRKEAESEGSLPLLAMVDGRIIKWVEVPSLAAFKWTNPVNKETKGNDPEEEHDKIERPERESPCHWQDEED